MPDRFHIRPAVLADIPALAALHVRTFKETHGWWGAPSLKLRTAQWQQIFENKNGNWFCLVIEKEDGELAGFARGVPYDHADQPEYAGELNKIYILRRYQKLGLGRQLLRRVTEEFLKRGIGSMLLFGDAKNKSNGFYEHMGAERLFSAKGEFHGGYGWKNLQLFSDGRPEPASRRQGPRRVTASGR